MKIYANLHTHTTHSDGVYTPEEIVKIAYDEGYRAFTAADHDTITAYPEVKAECEKYGMESILGCEFTGYSEEFKFTFHITAYGFDPEYPEMKEYLRRCSARIRNQTEILFHRGVADGFIPAGITWQDVLDHNKGVSWLCNDHVFRSMKAMGLATDLDYPDFFKNAFGKRRGEVPDLYEFLPLPELLDLIKRAGGIAFVAHPHNHVEDIPGLMKLGITGLEIWHSLLTDEEKIRGLEIARDYNLYVSGGSDHEGLCGGQYAFYEDYKNTEYYIPECSAGTTKEFFDEIVNRKFMPDREQYINGIIEELKAKINA